MPIINNAGDVALSYVSPTLRILPVVVAGKHDTFWLFHIDVRMQQTVEETMIQIHRLLQSTEYRRSSAIPRGCLSNLFLKEYIHKAEISMVISASYITYLISASITRMRIHRVLACADETRSTSQAKIPKRRPCPERF